MAQGTGGLQLQHFTGTAGPGAQQPHAAPSSPEQRPSLQQQRINKSFARLAPCSTVSQANALDFDCEPDLCDYSVLDT